jgi:hypothetical protein
VKTDSKATLGRRRFFRALGAGAAAIVTAPLATAARSDSETNDEKMKSRYKQSDHVKAFYQVNRYPS